MTPDAAITLAVILVVLVVLVADRVSPALAVLGGTVTLLLTGVIDADQAFSGFSNSAPLTVAALYVLAAAAARTRVIETMAGRIAARIPGGGEDGGERGRLARIVVPTAASSAVLNNTPIVAMAIPGVMSWARRTGRSPSRYLMPISFAAVVGGTVTLIGTSTNLVVSGLLEESGQEPMGLFEIGKVGLPFAIVSVIVMILVTPLLLPDRRAPSEDADADAREFTLEMLVEPGAAIAGRSVAEAGLRNLQGVFLVEIERDGQRISSVRPDEILAENDRLTFAGNVERIIDLQQIRGLVSAEERHFGRVGSAIERRLFEAVVAPGSALVGSTLKETGFRGRYGGAVIAVHRADERVEGKLGEVRLHSGDVLIVLAGPAFRPRALDRRDFLVVAAIDGEPPPLAGKGPLVGLVIAGMIALVSS
jgi:di/tricarboxylate transporter